MVDEAAREAPNTCKDRLFSVVLSSTALVKTERAALENFFLQMSTGEIEAEIHDGDNDSTTELPLSQLDEDLRAKMLIELLWFLGTRPVRMGHHQKLELAETLEVVSGVYGMPVALTRAPDEQEGSQERDET